MQIRSELEYRQAQMRLQQIENQVGIEIRNAQYAVQQNRASVDSAKAAVELARQSLDAEQKKYQFGTSTTTLVLQYQSRLATSESTLVNAMVAYEKSRIELDRATGTLLDHNGISIDDAARGQVTRLPNVPYIAPRKEMPSAAQPAPQAAAPQQPSRSVVCQSDAWRGHDAAPFSSSNNSLQSAPASLRSVPLRWSDASMFSASNFRNRSRPSTRCTTVSTQGDKPCLCLCPE